MPYETLRILRGVLVTQPWDLESYGNNVIKKVEKPNFDIDTQRRREYGTIHEIYAVATLTGKVLLFLYPNQTYFEEGCVRVG